MKFSAAARKLYFTGAVPMRRYGQTSMGQAPTALRVLRKEMLCLAMPPSKLSCPLTTIDWKLGENKDPTIDEPVRQVAAFLSIFIAADVTRRNLFTTAWRACLDRLSLLAENRRWSWVRGPISASVCAVLSAGWSPLQPLVWGQQQGGTAASRKVLPSSLDQEEKAAAKLSRPSGPGSAPWLGARPAIASPAAG